MGAAKYLRNGDAMNVRILTVQEWTQLDSLRKKINKTLPEGMRTNHTCGGRDYEEYKRNYDFQHHG